MQTETEKKPVEKHHVQKRLCETRPPYRQGKKLTAVKIYTINSESQHLYFYGVAQINLRNELKTLCMKYGSVKNVHIVPDVETEKFTECYHVHYETLSSARIAKRVLDNRSFYGNLLHVCYAPECESVEETRAKLNKRRIEVARMINEYSQNETQENPNNAQYPQISTHNNGECYEYYNTDTTGFNQQNYSDNNLYNNSTDTSNTSQPPVNSCNNHGYYNNSTRDFNEAPHVSNQNDNFHKNGKHKKQKRFFKDIYEADDPILAKRKRPERNNESTVENDVNCSEIAERRVYGPSIEDLQNVTGKLIPAVIVKSNLNVTAKRIVFKKKGFGLHDKDET